MKQLNEIAWNVDEETYRADEAFSYSLLAKYERGGFNILQSLKDREESPALTFGSLVDCLLTDNSRFETDYYVADIPQLSDVMLQIANDLSIFGSSYTDENIISVANKYEYYKNWKDATRVEKIKQQCEQYLNIKIIANNRIIISTELYNQALNCVNAIKDNPLTTKYFEDKTLSGLFSDEIQVYHQLKFKVNIHNHWFKCMFDCLYVNNNEKTIQPVDLKTSGKPEWEFSESFIKWNYQIQARLYYRILKEVLKDTEYADYEILPFNFVVINKDSLTPLVWNYEDTIKEGTLEYNNDVKCRDPFEIADELFHYLMVNPAVPDGITTERNNSLVNQLNLKK